MLDSLIILIIIIIIIIIIILIILNILKCEQWRRVWGEDVGQFDSLGWTPRTPSTLMQILSNHEKIYLLSFCFIVLDYDFV